MTQSQATQVMNIRDQSVATQPAPEVRAYELVKAYEVLRLGPTAFTKSASAPIHLPAPPNYQIVGHFTYPELQHYVVNLLVNAEYPGGGFFNWQLSGVEGDLHIWQTPPNSVDPSTTLGLEVLKRFSAHHAVVAIYRDDHFDSTKFWILTGNQRYDDSLLDSLIEEEKAILRSYSDQALDFVYLPSGGVPNPREVVGDKAVLIFKKQ